MRNYDMAVALSDYTPNLSFADALAQTGAPTMLTSLTQLELYAKGHDLALTRQAPARCWKSALSGFKSNRHGRRGGQVAPDRRHLRMRSRRWAARQNLAGKTVHHLGRGRRAPGLVQASAR